MKKNEKLKAVTKIRAITLQVARQWLDHQGFVEIQGPVLTPALGEKQIGFLVEIFEHKAYLSGGLQPYSDIFVEALKRIYTVAPAFRAERGKSRRHLVEFWRIEAVAQGYKLGNMLQMEENMVNEICKVLLKKATNELNQLNASTDTLANVKVPFPRITYDDAIEQLQSAGYLVNWGDPIKGELEQKLSQINNQPFFLTEYPMNEETFFHKTNPKKPELTLSADLYAPEGYGEMSTGAEAITEKKIVVKKLETLKIEEADLQWYLSLRRFSPGPQSGFSLGVERMLQWICNLKQIEEAIAFPRTYNSIYP